MGTGSFFGLTNVNMWGSMLKIRSKALASYIGLMDANMKANGRTVSSMAEGDTEIKLGFGAKASGSMERSFAGFDICSI